MTAFPAARESRRQLAINVGQIALLLGGALWLVVHDARSMHYDWQRYRVPDYVLRVVDGSLVCGPLAKGLFVTLEISALGLVLTMVIGLITAVLRLSLVLRGAAARDRLSRAHPQYAAAGAALSLLFRAGADPGYRPALEGVLCLAFFEGSYAAEIIRGGILSVAKGQWEASQSLGLSRYTGTARLVDGFVRSSPRRTRWSGSKQMRY